MFSVHVCEIKVYYIACMIPMAVLVGGAQCPKFKLHMCRHTDTCIHVHAYGGFTVAQGVGAGCR